MLERAVACVLQALTVLLANWLWGQVGVPFTALGGVLFILRVGAQSLSTCLAILSRPLLLAGLLPRMWGCDVEAMICVL